MYQMYVIKAIKYSSCSVNALEVTNCRDKKCEKSV